jgi:hypothetical protein
MGRSKKYCVRSEGVPQLEIWEDSVENKQSDFLYVSRARRIRKDKEGEK